MDYKIIIPSKNRLELITTHAIEFLIKYNLFYTKEIFIFVNIDDFDSYNNLFEDFDNIYVIMAEDGLNNQRNCIRDYFMENENLLFLDDDLQDIIPMKDKEINNLDQKIKNIFEYMKINNINLSSINPTNNPFFCSDEWKEGIFLCVGCFYFEINKKHELLYLNNQTSEKEDYIRTIQHYNIYGKVLRVDSYCVKHKYNKSRGGMNGENRIENNNIMINKLNSLYPNLTVIKKTKTKTELQFRSRNQIFKKLYLRKNEVEKEKGIYIDDCKIKLNKNRNYKIYDIETNQLLAIILRKTIQIPNNIYKLEKLNLKKNENAGHIAGKVDFNRLMPDKQKRIRDIKDFNYCNNEKTKIKINNFEFGNKLTRTCIGNKFYKGNLKTNYTTLNNIDMIKSEFNDFFNQISNLYEAHVPDLYNCSDYFLDTCFNQIQMNSSVRSANHKDTKNVGFSCMVKYSSNSRKYDEVEEKSKDIFFTDYNLRINLDNTDLIFFDSSNIAHSNPPIKLLKNNIEYKTYDNSSIVSLVFFKSKCLLIK